MVKIRAVADAGIDDLLVHRHRTDVGTSDGGRRVRAILRAPIEFLTADQGRVRIFHQVSGVPLSAAASSRGPRPRPPPGL